MKKLFNRLFKKQTEFSYIIAEYQPVKVNKARADFSLDEFEMDKANAVDATQADEMQIDKIYQRN